MVLCRYERDKEEFLKLVQECVDASKIRIYEKPLEDDPHYLVFDEYNPKIHDPFRESILKEKSNSVSKFLFCSIHCS